LTGECTSTFYKNSDAAADVCSPVTVCGKQIAIGGSAAEARATVAQPTTTSDRTCAACTTGTAANDADDCIRQATCAEKN
jgi:hypothetical protein